MSNQPRVAKVLILLLVSMTAGAVVLMVLPNNAPSAGPFCLSAYYRLESAEKAIRSRAVQYPNRWDCIEVYYSETKAGNIDQMAALAGLPDSADLNTHFIICNGLGGNDGQIQTTQKWQKQWSIIPGKTWYGTDTTVRICLIADGKTKLPTNLQMKRTQQLVEAFNRKFNIKPRSIYYPSDWQ